MNKNWPSSQWRSGIRVMIVMGATVMAASGCDKLLDVNLPGDVDASDLNNPALARSLFVSAVGEFECAYAAYVQGSGILSEEYLVSALWRNFNIWGARLQDLTRWTGPCQTTLGATNLGFYTALSRARFQADDVFERIEAFPAEEMTGDKTTALATLAAYGGYSYTLLGEGFCEMAIDGGPLMQPEEVFAVAEDRFTTAVQLAGEAGDDDLRNFALTGRARVRLNLGRLNDATADARQIPAGFEWNATYSTSTPRRQNRVYLDTHRNEFLTVAPEYRNLEVDGVADHRVPAEDTGRSGNDGSTALWLQQKYPSPSSPMPIASWEEAQLIIAEAELGQEAVDRINALRDHHGLPHYNPANVHDAEEILAQVLEERRRELFSQGHRLNDMLRHDIPFPTGVNHKGEPYGPITCMPLPEQERLANPNID